MEFVKTAEESVFLDPRDGFKEKRIPIEKRFDPLTGYTSRVLPFRFRLPRPYDSQAVVDASRQMPCPFCPGQVEANTPRFPQSLVEEGRLRRGEGLLVPNMYPYEVFSAVIRLTRDHDVPMKRLSRTACEDGFMLSLDYLSSIKEKNPPLTSGSVNCNYMPPSGAGMVHPHFQVLASYKPSTWVDRILRYGEDHLRSAGTIFWKDYVQEEEQRGERFIGRIGDVSFLAPYAPANLMGEVLAVFEGQHVPRHNPQSYAACFSEGLARILKGWWDLEFRSFNMSVYWTLETRKGFWSLSRIVPRAGLPPLETSDVNYYEKLHEEAFCVFSPEDMCSHLIPYFS